jgi:hypothetical protein
MSHGRVARLRVLVLLVAFGIGLLGQVVAAVAMPMAMQMPQHAVASGSSTADMGGCAGCPGQKHMPASPAMASTCLSVFCSVLPAVLPAGPIAAPVAQARFHLIAFRGDAGIAVRPDLGPPRPTHHR